VCEEGMFEKSADTMQQLLEPSGNSLITLINTGLLQYTAGQDEVDAYHGGRQQILYLRQFQVLNRRTTRVKAFD